MPFSVTSHRKMNRSNCISAISDNRTIAVTVNGFTSNLDNRQARTVRELHTIEIEIGRNKTRDAMTQCDRKVGSVAWSERILID